MRARSARRSDGSRVMPVRFSGWRFVQGIGIDALCGAFILNLGRVPEMLRY